jgi:hypothetical protein
MAAASCRFPWLDDPDGLATAFLDLIQDSGRATVRIVSLFDSHNKRVHNLADA